MYQNGRGGEKTGILKTPGSKKKNTNNEEDGSEGYPEIRHETTEKVKDGCRSPLLIDDVF